MPYLPTSQAFLEQSALLLEAYPETRITTKYSFPTERPSDKLRRQKSALRKAAKASTETQPPAASTSASAPTAALELKTYNPTTGICLKYRTNKAAEVGRLVTGLGKLAGGADVASLGMAAPVAGGDVEMTDAPVVEEGVVPSGAATPVAAPGGGKGQGQGQGQGGKGKKKGGKGKR